ncbi:major capsid protein P2 [Duganella sp. BuS-21]|uniref:major capsid protein P2 n=1 Tax=Duganella sp. BuS-21 TaxID=2943848 RepID=UPI0035A5B75C
MFNKPLQQAVGVAAGQIATIRIPAEEFTLVNVKLALSGTTFDKTKIDRVRVKVGARVIWDLTYAQINAVNNYKNGADNLKYLLLDFTERNQAIFPVKEIGGLDLMTLIAIGEVYIELYINASAVAPVINGIGYFEQRQKNPIVQKFVPFSVTQTASGRLTLPINPRGALLKRLWCFYSGTAWTASVNGNLSRMECKKNGVVFFDQMDLDNRFDQAQFKKVPQAGVYVVDFLIDDNHDAHITTVRNTESGQVYDAFEFNAYLTDPGGASMTVIAEVLDTVTNL